MTCNSNTQPTMHKRLSIIGDAVFSTIIGVSLSALILTSTYAACMRILSTLAH